jgi:tRNA_anti-like
MKRKSWLKKILITGFVLLLIGAGVIWYIFNEKHDDTAAVKSDYVTEAIPFIKEFEKDIKEANKKYAEKIIEVTGIVTESEAADTTINIKMTDTTSGSYLIFAFQQQHLQEAKTLKVGDRATIKGSCSDGIFSDILGTYFISFKRSTLLK